MSRLTMDWHNPEPMQRGDWLVFPKRRYVVLGARQIKRRDPMASPRFSVWCESEDRMLEDHPKLLHILIRRASHRNGGICYHCTWNPRKKKRQTFEQYMGAR
jgi:hypothetical protein